MLFDADLCFVWQTGQIMSPSYVCGQVQRLRLSTELSQRRELEHWWIGSEDAGPLLLQRPKI